MKQQTGTITTALRMALTALVLGATLAACPRDAPPPPSPASVTASAPPPAASPLPAPSATAGPSEATSSTSAAPPTPQAPTDMDGDGVADAEDACPYQPGGRHSTPADRGCPHHVRLTPGQISLLSRIEFDIDKDTLRPESLPILDEVAAVLSAHPEMALLEIQSHGPEEPHRASSITSRRARSVRAALVARGIDPARLQAKGYGESVPLAPPGTDEGRRLNRRIELRILPAPGPGP